MISFQAFQLRNHCRARAGVRSAELPVCCVCVGGIDFVFVLVNTIFWN